MKKYGICLYIYVEITKKITTVTSRPRMLNMYVMSDQGRQGSGYNFLEYGKMVT